VEKDKFLQTDSRGGQTNNNPAPYDNKFLDKNNEAPVY
jgi:hypothetical protein